MKRKVPPLLSICVLILYCCVVMTGCIPTAQTQVEDSSLTKVNNTPTIEQLLASPPPGEEWADDVRIEHQIAELLYSDEIVPLAKVFMKTPSSYVLEFLYPLSDTESEVLFLEVTKKGTGTYNKFVRVTIDKVIVDSNLTQPEIRRHGDPAIYTSGLMNDVYSLHFNVTLYLPSSRSMSAIPHDKGKFGVNYYFDMVASDDNNGE